MEEMAEKFKLINTIKKEREEDQKYLLQSLELAPKELPPVKAVE